MDKEQNRSLKRKHIQTYLSRYSSPKEYLKEFPVAKNLSMVITIPCFDEPQLLKSLAALHKCQTTQYPVEIIVMINQPVESGPDIQRQNTISYSDALNWVSEHNTENRRFHIVFAKDIPQKYAGVGMARKIVMDEALRRLLKANSEDGIIVGFDADCLCDQGYLKKIEHYFLDNPHANGATVFYEHPLSDIIDKRRIQGIASYELHLRYFIRALRYALFPYAFHTLGSCMVVRASAYAKQGGMNRRKAGEDFHFLHKIIPLGNFGEINTTKVIPSARISHRVPFGTGRAMMKWDYSTASEFRTYNPLIFEELRSCFQGIVELFSADQSGIRKYYEYLPSMFKKFIEKEVWIEKISSFQGQSASVKTYKDKFFRWMNGLKVLQYIHYAGDSGYHQVPVMEAFRWLNEKIQIADIHCENVIEGLIALRNYDLKNPYYYK